MTYSRHPERLHMQGPPYDDYRSRRDRSRSPPGRGGRDGPTERRRSPSPSRSSRLVEYETSDRRRSRSRSSHRVKYGTTSRRRSLLPLPSPCRVRDHSVPPLPIPCARWAVDQRPSWLTPLPLPSSPRLVVTPHRPEVLPSRLYARLALSCEETAADRTLAQDTRVRGEDLATARPQPLDEEERGRALADRVSGAAKRKAHPEGEGEDSERNPKRAREREIQEPRAEEGPAPLRMRFFVQDEMSRIFYARGLERVVKSSRADRHTLVDKQGEWVALRPHMTPKLASAADAEVYMREAPRASLSSAQQAPAYDALVARTNLCSAPDTLELLRTPDAPSEPSSAQQAPAYGSQEHTGLLQALSSGAQVLDKLSTNTTNTSACVDVSTLHRSLVPAILSHAMKQHRQRQSPGARGTDADRGADSRTHAVPDVPRTARQDLSQLPEGHAGWFAAGENRVDQQHEEAPGVVSAL
ncbi:hypothetical protein B0H14DRAFT_3503401 [Mycena olivaceomarginata]|nr:hypothetical protein B0H14DRAFT_3503401 [Mycena olivaceomarginata]